MFSIDDYKIEKDCIYKGEHYSVRDNGAIMRHSRKEKRTRKYDDIWTFGKPNEKTGYMEIAGERVHRIVAVAFYGEPPTEQHVVDHKDTNRRNNRPENLQWLTRLENALNNPITYAKIESICGSIENFLANPSLLKGFENVDQNFSWMRTVSKEEAHASLERWNLWAKNKPKHNGKTIGEWIYKPQQTYYKSSLFDDTSQFINETKTDLNAQQSLTANAIQINWSIPSEFPCCPQEVSDNALEQYVFNLKTKNVFCKNDIYISLIMEYAFVENQKSIIVMCKNNNIKPWSLARITYKQGIFYHENMGSYFEEIGVQKYFTLAQGKEWTGEDPIDDFC